MWRRPIARVRERMVLGQVRPLLEVDEHVVVWAHVHASPDDQPGLLSLTSQRCLVHWSPRDEASAVFGWHELTTWEVTTTSGTGAVLRIRAAHRELELVMPLTTPSRARKATSVVEHIARHAPSDAAQSDTASADVGNGSPLLAERRGLRGHARRVLVTIVGLLVVLVSAVFASPFVPGPGMLTFLAGLAILAKEYDWARDVHHWVKRKVDRLWRWLRARRSGRRRRRRDGPEVHDLDAARRRKVAVDDADGPGTGLGDQADAGAR